MTCFYCKGDMLDSTTTYVEDLGNCIIIIRNVPCSKCSAWRIGNSNRCGR
mgnify:CR=1 FL=1